LRIAKPFLNKALSSEFGWIKQIVTKAGIALHAIEEIDEPSEVYELRIVAETLRDEVVLKEE